VVTFTKFHRQKDPLSIAISGEMNEAQLILKSLKSSQAVF